MKTDIERTDDIDGPRTPRKLSKSALIIGIAFLSGLITGVVVTPFIVFHYGPLFMPSPRELPERITARMEKKLDLTESQARSVRAVFDESFEQMSLIRGDVQERMNNLLDSTRGKILVILTPEQTEKWTPRFDRLRKRHMRFGGPRFFFPPENKNETPDDD